MLSNGAPRLTVLPVPQPEPERPIRRLNTPISGRLRMRGNPVPDYYSRNLGRSWAHPPPQLTQKEREEAAMTRVLSRGSPTAGVGIINSPRPGQLSEFAVEPPAVAWPAEPPAATARRAARESASAGEFIRTGGWTARGRVLRSPRPTRSNVVDISHAVSAVAADPPIRSFAFHNNEAAPSASRDTDDYVPYNFAPPRARLGESLRFGETSNIVILSRFVGASRYW